MRRRLAYRNEKAPTEYSVGAFILCAAHDKAERQRCAVFLSAQSHVLAGIPFKRVV